jgi:hypothetical protein
MRRYLAVVAFVASLLPAASQAEGFCRTNHYQHHVGIKQINTDVYASVGGSCVHNIKPCEHCAVLSVTIASPPQRWTLRKLQRHRVEYRPRSTGEDNYTLRWCESPARKGCYLVRYHAHIQ